MPFVRPTLEQSLARMQADFKAAIPELDPYLEESSVVYALLVALNAGLHELNGRNERVARNRFVDQAELEAVVREGDVRGIPRGVATAALGSVEFTGTDGTVFPNGSIVLIGSQRYIISTFGPPGVVAGGVVEVLAGSLERTAAANAPVSSVVVLEEPIAGIDTAGGTVTATYSADGVTGGADDEDPETYRARLLDHIRRRPQGGTFADWRRWILESRVSHANATWTRPFVVGPSPAGSNILLLYAVDDALDPAGNAIAPAGAVYTAATAWLNANRRPLTSGFVFAAPTLDPLDPAITITPDTPAIRAAIKEEIVQLLIREATIAGAIPKSHYDEAVARARSAGLVDHEITSTVDAPVAAGTLQVIGTPVFS